MEHDHDQLLVESEVSPHILNLLENEVRRRAGHVTISYKGKIYLWGGYMEEVKKGTYGLMTPSSFKYHDPKHIWLYEPLLNIWYRKTCSGDIPLHLSSTFFASYENFLYIFGGYCGEYAEPGLEGVQNSLWCLNLDTLVWQLIFADGYPPFSADKGASWFYKDRFYVFGGFGCVADYPMGLEPYCHVKYVIDSESISGSRGWFDQLVYYDLSKAKWIWPRVRGTVPSPRAAHAVALIGETAFIFGGRHKENRLNDFYSLDLTTHIWTVIETSGPVPEGRSWHTLTALSGHQLILYGGFSTLQQVLSDIWYFDLKTGMWHNINWIPASPRLWHCSVKIGQSEIISLGGFCNNLLDNSCPKLPNHLNLQENCQIKNMAIYFCPDDCWCASLQFEGCGYGAANWQELELPYDHGEPRCDHRAALLPDNELIIISGLTQPYYLTRYLLVEHAEDMLSIRFSPPSLFKLVLEYLSNTIHKVEKWRLNELPPFVRCILDKRTDPFEVHGL